ncbi:MAG: O-antigen ligase family protein [Gammaproteobacteria bacterium]|nr:O-antigen ligase family protein [Gammaproteobacteria bacterium]MBU1722346.1 O-antigen ligase family protein [Gammaproteobacteria bacterium]MBU2004717.1 O-antigen ligase family protein [Gammaproteobacteria bacterium]
MDILTTHRDNTVSQQSMIESWRRQFYLLSALLAGVAIPISTAAENIGALLLLVALLVSPFLYPQIKSTYSKPFAIAGTTLGIALAIGIIWSSATPSDAWGFFIKMHPYYLIPFFLVIFSVPKVRNTFFAGFALGVLINVVLSCIAAWNEYYILNAVPDDWSMFRSHSYHNYFAGLLAVSILIGLLNNKFRGIYRWVAIGFFLLINYNILFLVAGRTGQLIYLLMIGLTLISWKPRAGIIAGVILALSTAFILPNFSPAIQKGVNITQSNLISYSEGNVETPTGLRLDYYKSSIALLKEKPFFGHGTGSFVNEYRKLTGIHEGQRATNNPHNDYLKLGIELGIIGIILLPLLLITAAWQGRHLVDPWRWMLYAVLTSMGVATLANSFFMDTITGVAFVLLTCALLNGPQRDPTA